MAKSELKNLSTEDLNQKERDLKKEVFTLNYQRHIGRVEKPHLFKKIKKDIARIKTFLHQKQGSNILKNERAKNTEKTT